MVVYRIIPGCVFRTRGNSPLLVLVTGNCFNVPGVGAQCGPTIVSADNRTGAG